VVEDAVNGIQAAQAAQMRCVAVAQSFPAEQLQSADLIRATVAEVALQDLTGNSAGQHPTGGRPWNLGITLLLSLAIIAGFLAAQVATALALVIGATVAERPDFVAELETGEQGLFLAVAAIVACPVAVGLVALFVALRRGISLVEYLALKPVPLTGMLRWLVALAGLVVASDLLTLLIDRPIVPNVMVEAYRTVYFPPLIWLALIVAAPLSEELFFRVFLFKGILHSPLGGVGAVLITSALWAVIHLQYDWYGMTLIFLSGLLVGYSRWRTGSIWPPLAMHALMNTLATIQVMLLLRFGQGEG
jgi:membrane protease YdiL (CAAX protease family)